MPNAHTSEELVAAINRVPDELCDQIVLHGTPDDVARRIREYEAVGVSHLSIVDISAIGGDLSMMVDSEALAAELVASLT